MSRVSLSELSGRCDDLADDISSALFSLTAEDMSHQMTIAGAKIALREASAALARISKASGEQA